MTGTDSAPGSTWVAPNRSYLVVATARTGSSLLCDYMRSLGRAGNPDEYFQPGTPRGSLQEPIWLKERGRRTPLEYLRLLVDTGSTPDGTFGSKVNTVALREMLQLLRAAFPEAASDLDLVELAFPGMKAVFVTRLDKVAQAISTLRALETGTLNSLRPAEPSQKERYSFPLVEMFVNDIVAEERALYRAVDSLGVPIRTASYEDVVRAPTEVVESILRFLDVATEPLKLETRLRKQGDATSAEWIEKHHRRKLWFLHRVLLLAGMGTIVRQRGLRWYFLSSRGARSRE